MDAPLYSGIICEYAHNPEILTMKTYLYTTGAIALALAMGTAPMLAYADDGGSSTDGAVSVTATSETGSQEHEDSQERPRPTLYNTVQQTAAQAVRIGEDAGREGVAVGASTTVRASEEVQEREQRMASSSEDGRGNATSTAVRERALEQFTERIQLKLESTTTPAQTITQFMQMLQQRKQELDQEASSTATSTREILKEANQVRLAVHAFLASKDLLGGIGQQVSDIAQQVNQSVATTTNAEAQIQSRGFWTKLLFGGDSQAANTIADQVAQNKERIAQISDLLNQATTSAEVKAELQVQLEAMNQEQVRLENLAKSQNSLWGLFSWRF